MFSGARSLHFAFDAKSWRKREAFSPISIFVLIAFIFYNLSLAVADFSFILRRFFSSRDFFFLRVLVPVSSGARSLHFAFDAHVGENAKRFLRFLFLF